MNPFSTFFWFWRAWRGQSITLAAVAALAVLGVSGTRWLRHVASDCGAPWYVWLLAPAALVGLLARKERDWIPDPAVRRRWSCGLLAAALLLSWGLAHLAGPAH